MPTIIACHEVTDTDLWLASPKRAEVLPEFGASNIRTFVDPENPKRVGLVMNVAALEVFAAAIANPPENLAAAMKHDGVVRETMSVYVAS